MQRYVLSLLVAVSMLVAGTAAADDDPLVTITTLYRNGQVAAADQQLDAFLSLHPDTEQRCPLLWLAAEAERPLSSAKNAMRKCVAQCAGRPEAALAHAAQVRLLHLVGEDRAALAACDEFLAAYADDPAAPELLLLRGALELRLPRGSTSGHSFATFLAKYPGHPLAARALSGLGDSKIRSRDWEAAEQAYLRALQADPEALDLPSVYFHLGHAAEMQGKGEVARHYYRVLVDKWPETLVAWRAKDRLESTLAVGREMLGVEPVLPGERYAASVGVFPSLGEAERAARRFTDAGLRVHLRVRGKRCELLVGEFDSEQTAKVFAEELAKRFQVRAVPQRLP